METGAWAKGNHSGVISTDAMEELQAEFDAFRESSTQLEQELEEELQRVEARAKSSEDELRQVKSKSREDKAGLMRQLLECQRELVQVREESSQATRTARNKEEALEQATQNERRAIAEAESLREALDASTETVVFVQMELEELKTTTEETTRQLYGDLEDAHAELALITPMGGKGAVRLAGRCSGSQSTGSGIEGKRRFFQTTSSEEDNSDQGATPLSNGGEGVSPTTFRRLMTAADDVRDQHSGEEEVPCNGAEADCAEQKLPVGELRQNLMGHLRVCAASPSTEDNFFIRGSKKGYNSIPTDSTSICSSSQTPGSGRRYSTHGCMPIHDSRHASGKRSAPSSSVHADLPCTGNEAVLGSARVEAEEGLEVSRRAHGEILLGDDEICVDVTSKNEVWDDGATDATEDDCYVTRCQGIEEFRRGLSNWRPFAWCEPR